MTTLGIARGKYFGSVGSEVSLRDVRRLAVGGISWRRSGGASRLLDCLVVGEPRFDDSVALKAACRLGFDAVGRWFLEAPIDSWMLLLTDWGLQTGVYRLAAIPQRGSSGQPPQFHHVGYCAMGCPSRPQWQLHKARRFFTKYVNLGNRRGTVIHRRSM
ncbi:MAG: hypothetical protein FWD57_01960 [Polyangiaceae bacterium]|nr:hypothetical protein [Polyangiaceae bacterium]